MNEIELAKLGWEMYVKIFNGMGGWYLVGAFVALVTWMKLYVKA